MKVIVTIEESEKSNIQSIAHILQKMGLEIDHVMKITGIITGSTEKASAEYLKVKGVKSVETDRKKKAII